MNSSILNITMLRVETVVWNLIEALQESHEFTTIISSQIHYFQFLKDQASKCQLTEKYRTDPESRNYFHQLQALQYLPIAYVETGFNAIAEKMPQGWQEFTDEIEVNFIRGKRGVNSKYKPEMWNLHERILKGLPCTLSRCFFLDLDIIL